MGKAYLRARWRGLAALAALCAVFAVVFALYRLPLGAVGYGALLFAFLAAIAGAVDFYRFRSRHRRLQTLEQEVCVSLDKLPQPESLLEQDYQQLLQALNEARLTQGAAASRRYTELEEYFTIWAHQIKTPLAAMRLLLQQGQPDEGELRAQLQRVEQYVQMVLCYLRLSSDSTDYVLRPCQLDEIVRPAVHDYARQFIRKRLRLNYEGVHCEVLTDEKWLRFVIDQLLSNALKYTPEGGQVSITLEEPAVLVIADTGIGIAPEDLPRVFERGYTGYNGRRDQKASGIGLYLCRRILSKLGHDISIFSAPGAGTAVRVQLGRAAFRPE